ncbi:MAG: transglycosylase SLT domain-containing protein [Prevotellaceae bacterium]|jgi:membrane-bound lytic murein transglycosylase D|nr:transglycosylase SLT domain-containing protein [Prevotellaceae bacterium]
MNIYKAALFSLLVFSSVSAQSSYTYRSRNTAQASTTDSARTVTPSVVGQAATAPADVLEMLDENLHKWAREKAKYETVCRHADDPNIAPDSVYKDRLKSLPWIMEMPYNSIVRGFIDLYTVRKRRQMEYMLGISKYYFPIFEEALSQKGMPLELKYLPVIESAFNPTAVSSAGAAGLWQFIVPTGRAYGLEINSLVDERLDPIKSTYAATEYLNDLYKIYGDWHIVIAAYNCGPGNVRKAISRSGGKTDYWAMYPYLPAETRGYVPVFIAANYAFEFASQHNLCALIPTLPAITDTIELYERVHFQQIASVINIPYEELKAINPQYRQDIIPGTPDKSYPLRLPMKYIDPFLARYDTIVAYRASELVNNRRDEVEATRHIKPTYNSGSGAVRYHTVKRGQTLSTIAARYGVSVSNLKKWNGISGSKLRTGQKLKIRK